MDRRISNREHRQYMDAKVSECIAYNAYAVIKNPHVDGDSHSAFTVGMTQFQLPELIATGLLHPDAMQKMLDGILRSWAQVAPTERDTIQLSGILEGMITLEDGSPARVRLVEVDTKNLGKFRPQELRRRYSNLGKEFRMLQVLWPDKAGVLPDEEGYDVEVLQPLLPVKV